MKTNYNKLDEVLNGGLKSGSLTIIGARPSVGKTTFAYNILINNMKNGNYGALFSRESNINQMTEKLVSISGIKDESELSIYLSDEVIKLEEEIMEIKVLKKVNNNLNLVVIDYLQLHSEDFNIVLDKLKILATKLNIAIIVLSQLSRDVEERDNKRPLTTDLKIETDSFDNYLLLYRESYYENVENENDILEIIVNGKDHVDLLYNKSNCNYISFKSSKDI